MGEGSEGSLWMPLRVYSTDNELKEDVKLEVFQTGPSQIYRLLRRQK
jgi:hypothetical protein